MLFIGLAMLIVGLEIKTLQIQTKEFAQLVENSDVGNLPTPLAVKTVNEEIAGFNQFTDKMKSASTKIEYEYNLYPTKPNKIYLYFIYNTSIENL